MKEAQEDAQCDKARIGQKKRVRWETKNNEHYFNATFIVSSGSARAIHGEQDLVQPYGSLVVDASKRLSACPIKAGCLGISRL